MNSSRVEHITPPKALVDPIAVEMTKVSRGIEKAKIELIEPWINFVRLVDPFAIAMIAGTGTIHNGSSGRVADLDVIIISGAIKDRNAYQILCRKLSADAGAWDRHSGKEYRSVFYTRRVVETGYVERARLESEGGSLIIPIHLLWYSSFEEFHRRELEIARSLLKKVELVGEPLFPWTEFEPLIKRHGQLTEWLPSESSKFLALEKLIHGTNGSVSASCGDTHLSKIDQLRWDIERACAEFWTNGSGLGLPFMSIAILDFLRDAIRRARTISNADPETVLRVFDPGGKFGLVAGFRDTESIRTGAVSTGLIPAIDGYLNSLLEFSSNMPRQITASHEAVGIAEMDISGTDLAQRRQSITEMVSQPEGSPKMQMCYEAALQDDDIGMRVWGLAGFTKHHTSVVIAPEKLLPLVEAGPRITRILALQTMARQLPCPGEEEKIVPALIGALYDEVPVCLAAMDVISGMRSGTEALVPHLFEVLGRAVPTGSSVHNELEREMMRSSVYNTISSLDDKGGVAVLSHLETTASWMTEKKQRVRSATSALKPDKSLDARAHWDIFAALGSSNFPLISEYLSKWPSDALKFLLTQEVIESNRQVADQILKYALQSGTFKLAGLLIRFGAGMKLNELIPEFEVGLGCFENPELAKKVEVLFFKPDFVEQLRAAVSGYLDVTKFNRLCIGNAIANLGEYPNSLLIPLGGLLDHTQTGNLALAEVARVIAQEILKAPIAALGEREQAVLAHYRSRCHTRTDSVDTAPSVFPKDSYQEYLASNPEPAHQRALLWAAGGSLNFRSLLEIINYWHAPPRDEQFDRDIYAIMAYREELRHCYVGGEGEYVEAPKSVWKAWQG